MLCVVCESVGVGTYVEGDVSVQCAHACIIVYSVCVCACVTSLIDLCS